MANDFGCSSCSIQLYNDFFQFCTYFQSHAKSIASSKRWERPACRPKQTGTVRLAEVIACLIFILMEDLHGLSTCLNLADVQLAEIRKKCLLITVGLLGPLQFCRVTIVREFRLLLLEAFLPVLLITRGNFFNLCVTQFIKRLPVLQFCRLCSRTVDVHLHEKLFQYTQYFTTLTGILREILAGSLER